METNAGKVNICAFLIAKETMPHISAQVFNNYFYFYNTITS